MSLLSGSNDYGQKKGYTKAQIRYLVQLSENHPEWSDHELAEFYRRMTDIKAPGLKWDPHTYYDKTRGYMGGLTTRDLSTLPPEPVEPAGGRRFNKKTLIFVMQDDPERIRFAKTYGGRLKGLFTHTQGFDHVAEWAVERERNFYNPTFDEPIVVHVDRVAGVNKELVERDNIGKVIFIGHASRSGSIHPGMEALPETNISPENSSHNVHPADLYWGNLNKQATIEIIGCNSAQAAQNFADAANVPAIGSTNYIGFTNDGEPYFDDPGHADDRDRFFGLGGKAPGKWETKYPRKKSQSSIISGLRRQNE